MRYQAKLYGSLWCTLAKIAKNKSKARRGYETPNLHQLLRERPKPQLHNLIASHKYYINVCVCVCMGVYMYQTHHNHKPRHFTKSNWIVSRATQRAHLSRTSNWPDWPLIEVPSPVAPPLYTLYKLLHTSWQAIRQRLVTLCGSKLTRRVFGQMIRKQRKTVGERDGRVRLMVVDFNWFGIKDNSPVNICWHLTTGNMKRVELDESFNSGHRRIAVQDILFHLFMSFA